jgi:hypothetical protein
MCKESQERRRQPDLRQMTPAVEGPEASRSETAHERTNGKYKRKQNGVDSASLCLQITALREAEPAAA